MIAISALDNNYSDLTQHEQVARILAAELPELALCSEPLDIINSLEKLSDEMSHMPEIIHDCLMATEAFDRLDETIGRMYALADRAVELPDDKEEERASLDEDFQGYSHIVARLAGDNNFDGPSLSLRTKAAAITARQILSYLNGARQNFTGKLAAQRRQINAAMDEAVEMLLNLAHGTHELSNNNRNHLNNILERLNSYSPTFSAFKAPSRGPWLH
ncbi:MAG: hypothetical protein ACRCTY_10625 [Candidatus Adiutrix sp.]